MHSGDVTPSPTAVGDALAPTAVDVDGTPASTAAGGTPGPASE